MTVAAWLICLLLLAVFGVLVARTFPVKVRSDPERNVEGQIEAKIAHVKDSEIAWWTKDKKLGYVVALGDGRIFVSERAYLWHRFPSGEQVTFEPRSVEAFKKRLEWEDPALMALQVNGVAITDMRRNAK